MVIITTDPPQWTKDEWRELYAEYCKTNPDGPKTKKEYYDMVMARYQKRVERERPVSPELMQEWIAGRRAAKEWARAHGCNLNGELITNVCAETKERSTREIAEKAENIAIESVHRLDDLDEKIYQANLRRGRNEL